MSTERVLTVLGNKATRPITDFMLSNIGLGKAFYVDSNNGDDDRSGRSPETALATLDEAIGKCTANQGDVIYVLPGHAETVATAGAIACNVAGIFIIGLGEGADRPTFSFSAVDATMTVSAASIYIKNILIKPSIDSVVSPIVVSGPDCALDIEIQDATALIECVCGVLTTAAAERLNLRLKYRGFIAGNACVNAIRLVGVDTARVYVDFYGVASTAVVEFHTTACHDIDITGLFYNNGTTLTKNVVDTVGTSTWSVRGWDGNSNAQFSGGDNAAMATDDVTALATAIGVIDEFHDVPAANNVLNAQINEVIGNKTDAAAAGAVTETDTLVGYTKQIVTSEIANAAALVVIDEYHDVPAANNVLNAQINEVIGNKTDAAAAGAVTETDTLVGYVKQVVTSEIANAAALVVIDEFHDVPAANNVLNAQINEVIGNKTDTAAAGAVTETDTLVAYAKQNVTNTEAIFVDTRTTLPATLAALPHCVVKTDGACLAALDPLFTITGGPVRCKIVGLVTTVIGADVATFRLQHITTTPAATVELNVGAVAVTDDAAGTFYRNVGPTSVFTPSAGLGFELIDPVTIEETEFLLAPGVVQCLGSAANTGVIAWYMTYVPLSPASVVTAAE
jgi:hypothetical protein